MFLISLRAGGVQEILRNSGMELKRFDFLIEPPVIQQPNQPQYKGTSHPDLARLSAYSVS